MTFHVRVPIDLNNVDKDGLTVVRFSRVGVALQVGEEVIAYEAEDGVEAPAIVERLHPTREVAYVRVDRSRMVSIDPAEDERDRAAHEAEVSADLAAGRFRDFASAEEAVAWIFDGA